MAENEILDLGGRRWQRSRAALANPNFSLTVIAECAGDDLNRGLRMQLTKAFRKGQTLLDVLRATESHPAAARAAVQSFQDQGLAQIIQNAAKIMGSRDPSAVANCAADLLLAAVRDRTLVNAGRNESFQNGDQRASLARAIEAELETRHSGIVATIERSLRGQPSLRLRTGAVRRITPPVTASALVGASLSIQRGDRANE